MVVVEEVGDATPFPPAAVVITGAGLDSANGLYAPTGKTWHDAPVFENDQKCLLSREPHKSQKTGQMAFGWIIGQDRKPLYGIQSEGLVPPSAGWQKYKGVMPAPQLQALPSLEEAARTAGQAWKDAGNKLFSAKRYDEASAQWTRALGFLGAGFDEALQVALHANRAEARLRQKQWEGTLQDAQSALELRPDHEKALLRATVAAKELGRLDKARDFVQRCLEVRPNHPEARQLMADVELAIEGEGSKDAIGRAKAARAKLQESIQKEAVEGDLSKIPKAFASTDQSSKKGLKAFAGYGEKRANQSEPPPLSDLPHHHMGLPPDQISMMDKFFKEMREKRAERELSSKQLEESGEVAKKERREEAEQDRGRIREEEKGQQKEEKGQQKEGKAAPVEAPKSLPQSAQAQRQPAEPVELSKQETDAIDSLFASIEETVPSAEQPPALPKPTLGKRRQQIQEAKGLLTGGKDAGRPDRRTARERELDAEEAEERKKRDLRILYELKLAQAKNQGEPGRLEQAGTEVYAWWMLPSEVSGRDIRVKATGCGTWLTVTVREVVIFNAELFDAIRADEIIWSINDGELHLTLTKAVKNKLWEQLGKVSTIQRDENGQVRPETLPEALSGGERIEMFKQMIGGDDGVEFNYDDLDESSRAFVDVMRRYKHAMATGDQDELSLAEMELEEFGKMVI